MRVLVACERSGVVRDAFRRAGHDAWSSDIEAPSGEFPEFHLLGDVRRFLRLSWDLMIAHPPCTYLSSSGLHRTVRGLRPLQLTEDAVQFVYDLIDAAIPRVAIENPVGFLGRVLRPADQIIQPYQFGHDASKATCLWLRQLPLLKQTRYVEPRMVNGKPRWANQTDSGQNRLSPGEARAALRAETYPGIASAMVEQWGILPPLALAA